MEFPDGEHAYRRFRIRLILLCAGMGILLICGGLTLAGRMAVAPSVMLPFSGSVILVARIVFHVVRVLSDGMRFKVLSLRRRFPALILSGMLLSLSALIGAVAAVFLLFRFGDEGLVFFSYAYPVFSFLLCAVAMIFTVFLKKSPIMP